MGPGQFKVTHRHRASPETAPKRPRKALISQTPRAIAAAERERLPRLDANGCRVWTRTAAASERKRLPRQTTCSPPLTCKVSPVMYPAASLTRNATASAMSEAVPIRPRGMRANSSPAWLSDSLAVMSVAI